ncbi:amine acid ABC transporter, permease protein, 3-TM region, His/Glu/Gln/Arg/opine family [Lachnospiraceae bacterium JC7]|nr:amine acid ABC transporter, permease protein, 3-TM region, His/Glu/Gln/Arg/opine family [Lachnospiraceae bacterium JC7]
MFNTSYFVQVIPKVFMKIPVTLEIAVISTFFALLIGVIIAVIAYYRIPVLYPLTRGIVSFTRGTPLVAQLYFLYFGVAIYSTLVRDMTPTMAVCLVLSINVGAFMSESIRGALMSVDDGQKEAALSLGMSGFQIITRIVLPQAVRVALPPLFNDFITLIKSSSLAFMLGVADIMGAARMEGSMSYRYFEVYAVVMIAYWILITGFGLVRVRLEKHCAEAF